MNQTRAATAIADIVDSYVAIWNETDPERRRELIAATWAPEAVYVDPLFTAEGHDALEQMVAAAQQQYPGYRIRQVGSIDHHHAVARWGWELVGPDGGPPAVVGVDVAALAPDGRLREVAGFFD